MVGPGWLSVGPFSLLAVGHQPPGSDSRDCGLRWLKAGLPTPLDPLQPGLGQGLREGTAEPMGGQRVSWVSFSHLSEGRHPRGGLQHHLPCLPADPSPTPAVWDPGSANAVWGQGMGRKREHPSHLLVSPWAWCFHCPALQHSDAGAQQGHERDPCVARVWSL